MLSSGEKKDFQFLALPQDTKLGSQSLLAKILPPHVVELVNALGQHCKDRVSIEVERCRLLKSSSAVEAFRQLDLAGHIQRNAVEFSA